MPGADHDPLECFHSYLDAITLQTVRDTVQRFGLQKAGITYTYKTHVFASFPHELKQRLGPRIWTNLVAESMRRLRGKGLLREVGKIVHEDGCIALSNPLDVLARIM